MKFNSQICTTRVGDYRIAKIPCSVAKEYIIKNHYSHGCHKAPSPCYGLYRISEDNFTLFEDDYELIGVIMFATPCSENVRASVFGEEYKDWVIELHRLHILDVTPRNTESWFISRVLKMLKEDRPQTRAVISFSDTTEGHEGVIYKATNAYRVGTTGSAIFYRDKAGRLHHPRQNGVNITTEMANERGWIAEKRSSKNRYLYLLPQDKRELKRLKRMCRMLVSG